MSGINRRQFLTATAAASAAGLAAGCLGPKAQRVSPNGKVAHACIGVG
ncbi:MAG: twin-arginine translocation signal domain-containing protein, partial [Verrucomicrobiota bacterium]|nr:twin-arginine translocation signal domain-containing protein [Verrucomicrobiota bacterium]